MIVLFKRPKTPLRLILNLLFFTLIANLASAQQTSPPADSAVNTATIASRLANRNFNEAYLQTFRPSFFGQEIFQPIKTMLVGDFTANFVLLNTPKSRFFFDVEARIKLRLLQGQGAPVKSPSYMPGGKLYYRLNADAYHPKFLTLSYTHHSNGVRGPSVREDGSLNRDSGKFSTNFYTLNYTVGRRTDYANTIVNRYANVALEVHSGLFGLGESRGLKDHYGFVRVNGGYLYNIAKKYTDPINPNKQEFHNWQRVSFDFTYIADKVNGYSALNVKKRINANLRYYYQFPFMQNVSFLVGAGYRGQDDYNIFFEDNYAYMQFGIASGLSFLYHKN